VWHHHENRAVRAAARLSGAPRSAATARADGSKKGAAWVRAGMGLGATICTSHIFWGGHSVLPRFTQIEPFPGGVIVILVLVLGVCLMRMDALVQSRSWFFFGFVSCCVFILGQNQNPAYPYSALMPPAVEFAGGLGVVLYVTSIWVQVIRRFAALGDFRSMGKALFMVWLTYLILNMWVVYVVGYKFMDPVLGPLLRERSFSHALVSVAICGLGALGRSDARVRDFLSDLTGKARKAPKNASAKSQEGPPKNVQILLAAVVLCLLAPTVAYRVHVELQPSHILQSLPGEHSPQELREMTEGKANIPVEIRGLTWAIHFGYTNFGGNSGQDLTRVIKETGANVIGMVETDTTRTFMGNRDYTEYLGAQLGFYTDYGPSTAQNTFGCNMLSLFPITRSNRVILPSPDGELACLIDADILVNGTTVHVLIAHIGNTEDTRDRDLQHGAIREIVKKSRASYHPTVLLSYLTGDVWGPHYRKMIQSGMSDSSPDHNRYCLYVLYRDLDVRGFQRIDQGEISDTEAQVGIFRLLPDEGSNLRSLPSDRSAKDYCRSFYNDTVQCQARRTQCGWCEVRTWGSCFEPEQVAACNQFFESTWVGPESELLEDEQPVVRALDQRAALDAFLTVAAEVAERNSEPVGKHTVQLNDVWTWDLPDLDGRYNRTDLTEMHSAPQRRGEELYEMLYWIENLDEPKEGEASRYLNLCLERVSAPPPNGATDPQLVGFKLNAPNIAEPGVVTIYFHKDWTKGCWRVATWDEAMEASRADPENRLHFVATWHTPLPARSEPVHENSPTPADAAPESG
jgi:PGAP2IP, second transmembrane domain